MDSQKKYRGGKQLYIQHVGNDSPKPAREYLISLGVSLDRINVLFDENGDWKYKVQDRINPFEYEPEDLKNLLIKHLTPIYDVVNISLDSFKTLGFAKHDIPHINDVTTEVLKILKIKGSNKKTQIIACIAGVSHDLGNMLSRNHHSKLSPLIFKLTFPNFKLKKYEWFRVKDAIVYHDEPVIHEEIGSWGELTTEEKLEKFREVFKEETLSLLISDKTRVNRKRLSDKNRTMEAIDKEEHYEVNLLGDTKSIEIEKNTAKVNFDYNPYATEEEAQKYPGFFKKSKHFGYRAGVSKQAIELHKLSTPIDNFSTWRHKYWKIYSDRTFLTIYSMFALFPELNEIQINMRDYIYPNSTSYEEVKYSIDRKELKNFEKFVFLKYLKK
jgi:hypothetical protein